jgi:dihydrofolate reductase
MNITLYMAMTVNGYIAREDDSAPWSDAEMDSYCATVKEFSCLILGRRTYEIMKQDGDLEKIGNPFTVVLSNQGHAPDDHCVFVKSPKEALEALSERGFDRALIGGGGMVNASFMKEGLIDEIILDIESMIFGEGMPLFANGDFETRLQLVDVKKLSGHSVQLRYAVER